MIVVLGDLDIGWRTIWMEARDQGYPGMYAVGWVLRNRVEFREKDRWCTVAQVCLDWLQFSGWRENDPNFQAAMRQPMDELSQLCLAALCNVLVSPRSDDPTKGSRHYCNLKLANPAWAKDKTPAYVYKDHTFFNDIA